MNVASNSYTAKIEEALWLLHSYESNRDDGGRVYSELDIAEMVAALRGSDGPNSEFSIKRAAYVLSVAVLQSDLTLDEEVRAAMDLAVSLGQDRAVMYNRPPHATSQPFLCLGEGLTMRCPNQCADCQKEQAKNER